MRSQSSGCRAISRSGLEPCRTRPGACARKYLTPLTTARLVGSASGRPDEVATARLLLVVHAADAAPPIVVDPIASDVATAFAGPLGVPLDRRLEGAQDPL